MNSNQNYQQNQHQWNFKFDCLIWNKVQRRKQEMIGQKRQLLYNIAHPHFLNEPGIDKVENVNKPNPKNEYFYIGVASQQSCNNWQKPIKKSLLAVILSPSLNPLG